MGAGGMTRRCRHGRVAASAWTTPVQPVALPGRHIARTATMSRHRIVFLMTAIGYGGAETQLIALATRLQSRGWQVRVVSMLPPEAATEELVGAGIPVATLGMTRGVPDPRAIIRLAALLRRWRPRVVHSHMVHANLLARVARPLYRAPVLVATAHNIDEGPDKRTAAGVARQSAAGQGGASWRERAYRLTDPLCDLTTNVSQAAVDRYVRVGVAPRRKIRFVPNGIDTARFRPDAAARERLRRELGVGGRFAWLAVGRLEAAKDHRTLIQAFAALHRQQPGALLLLAGHGRLRPEIEAHVAAAGLAGAVQFLGLRSDIPDLMNAADAYVMSSAWEGLPMVLLEAGAVGLPIVATAVGGNGEVVIDGENGFVVPPRRPDALLGAMGRVMALPPPARARLGAAGRLRVEARYSLDRVVDQWEAIYGELLARKGMVHPGGARRDDGGNDAER